jgi:hypothetical protein
MLCLVGMTLLFAHAYTDPRTLPREWLALAREYADHAQQLPRMPRDPEITQEALKPYLRGWSPYGPQRW